jgi:hypothetical protein
VKRLKEGRRNKSYFHKLEVIELGILVPAEKWESVFSTERKHIWFDFNDIDDAGALSHVHFC